MCARYVIIERTLYDVEKELGLEEGSFDMMYGDVTPAMNPLVLCAEKGSGKRGIRMTDMYWGLTGKDKKLMINARAESAFDKPMFADSIEHRRCVMPASAFYEWDKEKTKVTFFRKDKRPIYLAGFYQLSDNRDSFVVLTTSANESMIQVHDRMPLMIESESVRDWLYDRDAAKEMLNARMPQLDSHRDYEQLSLF